MEYLSTTSHTFFNSDILKLLNEAQIFTAIEFLNCDCRRIEKITNLTLREVLEIRKTFVKKYSRPKNANDYYQSILTDCAIIPTGIERLDCLLEGGLFTGNIYEICGLPASGKTLFCLTLLKNIAPNTNEEILYLDSKCDFLGLKMKQLFSDLNKEELISAMNKIQVTRVSTQEDLLKTLLLTKHSIENGKRIRLIIIDSLPPLSFLSSNQMENNAFLSYTSNILYYLAKEFNVIIIVTNLMTLWNDGDFKNTDVMKEKISCGSYWYGVPNVRIRLKKNKDICSITLLKTFKFIPEIDSCDIQFTDKGLV